MERKLAEKILKDLRAGCGCQEGYCPVWFVLRLINPKVLNVRLVEQEKCIEIFKYEESNKVRHDINQDDEDAAVKLWYKTGLAKRFGDVYQDGMSASEIYRIITSPNYKDKPAGCIAASVDNQVKSLDDKVVS